jgi:hypothetical protein
MSRKLKSTLNHRVFCKLAAEQEFGITDNVATAAAAAATTTTTTTTTTMLLIQSEFC